MSRAVALCAATVAAASGELLPWSDGEVTDEVELAKPALSEEVIRAVNSDPAATWLAGRNARFEGVTLKQATVLMGAKRSTDRSSWLPHRPLDPVAIPDEFDWRTDPRAAKCPSVKEIRDQADCGSCWAFGAVEAMTDRICIASNGTKNVHLSAQDVMACDHGSGFPDMGCSGGMSAGVYKYYKSTGIVSGGNYGDKSGCWSYQLEPCAHHVNSSKYKSCDSEPRGAAGKCAKKCTDNAALTWETDKHFGTGYAVCENQDKPETECTAKMAQDIYQNGPITVSFTVYKSFLTYKSGVYQHKAGDAQDGGHAVKMIGYGNENGVPYWLIANSWNEGWGLGGFFKMIRGKNEGKIEDPHVNGGPFAGEPTLPSRPSI